MSEPHPTLPTRPVGPRLAGGARWILVSAVLHGAAFVALAGVLSGPQVPPARPAVITVAAADVRPTLQPDPEVLPPVVPEVSRACDVVPADEDDAPPAPDWDVFDDGVRTTVGLGPAVPFASAGGRIRRAAAPAAPVAPAAEPVAAPAPEPRPVLPPRGASRHPRFAQAPAGPDYPEFARRRGWEGRVLVRIDVSADGRVADVRVLESSGRDVLDEAALDAARGWTLEPALRDGVPVQGTIDVPVVFRLDG